jgi:aminoglycoside phosphotransferase (APT) family kinase protein
MSLSGVKIMKRKSKPTDSDELKADEVPSDRAQAVVDIILARLTQLHPTQDVGHDDNGQPGDFARHAIGVFQKGVARATKKDEEEGG